MRRHLELRACKGGGRVLEGGHGSTYLKHLSLNQIRLDGAAGWLLGFFELKLELFRDLK